MGADSHVVPLEQIRGEHASRTGSSAAALAGLMQAGFPMPPAFVVTSEACAAYLDDPNLSDKLSGIVGELDFHDRAALERASAAAINLITDSPEPRRDFDDVRAAYQQMGGGLVAVRASAASDDLDAASLDVREDVFLNVSGVTDVMNAIRACRAAQFEPRALHYRAQCGDQRLIPTVAVVVQRMVQSARSGTACSIDPLSHAHDTIVIEAIYGLGAPRSTEQVTPDMYLIDKASLAVQRRTVVDQPRELVHAAAVADAPSRNEWRAIPAERRSRPKLDDGEIARLAEIVRRIEQHCGTPQTTEWAEENGELYVVGSRPVMALAHTH